MANHRRLPYTRTSKDLCPPTLCVLVWIHRICVQDTGKLDLWLDSPILLSCQSASHLHINIWLNLRERSTMKGCQKKGSLVLSRGITYLDCIFVVRRSEDLLDNQLSGPGHDDRVVAEIGVLKEDSIVFLVDTDGVLDLPDASCPRREVCIQIVNAAFTVTTQRETVGHIASSIFAQVEGMLPLMWMFRVSALQNAVSTSSLARQSW